MSADNINDQTKPSIKKSLHVIATEDMSKKLSQNFQSNQRTIHLTPFKVDYNRLKSDLPSFVSEYKINGNNQVNGSENEKNNCKQMRPNSCPAINRYGFGNNDECKTHSDFISNSLQSNNFQINGQNSQLFPYNSAPKLVSQHNYQNLKKTDSYSKINDKVVLIPQFSPNEPRLKSQTKTYSCPSSPVINTFENSFNYTLKRTELTKSFESISSECDQNISPKFDPMHGSDVSINCDLTIAERYSSSGTHSYVFVAQQISIGMKIVIRILSLDEFNQSKGSFVFGLTDINPSMLKSTDLPSDARDLIERKGEYWTLVDHFCDNCKLNDRLTFVIDSKGFVWFSINSQPYSVLFPTPNPSRKFWPFFIIIGKIKTIQLIDSAFQMVRNSFIDSKQNDPKSGHFNSNSIKHLYKCINCFTNYANTAFYKCGHKYYCFNCAKQYLIFKKKCPFCYQTIYDIIIIYP